MVLVGRKAPDFNAGAVLGNGKIIDNFSLSRFIEGKKAVLFFYPLDFTFVCPSEIIAFDRRLGDFQERSCQVIGISIDSVFSHNAWRNMSVAEGGIGKVKYPLIADTNREIVAAYNVMDPKGHGTALRGSFLVDEDRVIRHQVVNDSPIGRNVDEILRMVDALAFYQENGEVCPAQWEKGKAGMEASPEGVAAYLSKNVSDLER